MIASLINLISIQTLWIPSILHYDVAFSIFLDLSAQEVFNSMELLLHKIDVLTISKAA